MAGLRSSCQLASWLSIYPSSLCRVLIIVLSFVQLSSQQKNPVTDFCRRFGHQAAVIDQKLIIDGGLVNWNPISQNPGNYSNTWLLYDDLSSVNSAGMPQLYANLSKNSSIPDVSGGTLWADDVNKRVYLFGGETNINPPASIFNLFAYDPIYDKWDSFGPPSTLLDNVAWGAGATVSERGEGYYYGGWVSNMTTSGYTGDRRGSTALVKYTMDKNSFQNYTGPSDNIPRAEGVMVYIPASDRGLLIYFGGVNMPYFNSTVSASPMNEIHIYDIASSSWYVQQASGDTPNPRRRFCAGAAWAADRSSYNIYLYGGAGFAPNETGYDDIYILTLPSFTWLKWYPTDGSPGRPHGSLTCNVVNGAQMLITGGTFPNDTECDAADVTGTHNLDLGEQNSDKAKWHAFQPNISSYIVPDIIVSQVGGNSLGKATVTAPATWGNHDLPVLFTRQATVVARTATRSIPTATGTSSNSSSRKLSTGAIVGVAIGGVAILALLAVGCLCISRKRRNHRRNNPPQQQYPTAQYNHPYDPHNPPSQYHQSPPQPYMVPQQQAPVELAGYQAPYVQQVSVEPKYDRIVGEAMRHGSIQHEQGIQNLNQQPVYGVGGWHSDSPHTSQGYPTPTASPHPSSAFTIMASPSELSAGQQHQNQSSPAPTYTSLGRKAVSPAVNVYPGT